ncbi:alpha/beta fold hydrolase [Lentzea sp. CA-135723]|uniref:alpha/beta fold hydrolase n=1 Tax=Lentzea sp. CA-135723 TaxID=3239950 RepID=UPI003D910981
MNSHTTAVDGIPVTYHVAGQGPVCLLHPGGPGFTWEYLRSTALEEHLTTVYVEPLGTGASGRLASHPHGYTRALHARAVEAVLNDLGVEQAHLLGHSYGGFVTQYCATHLADRLSGVILYDSAPASDAPFFAEASRGVEEFLRRHPDATAVSEAWQQVPTIGDDETFARVARAILPLYFADFRGHEAFEDVVHGGHVTGLDELGVPDLIDDRGTVETITVDTLVLVGQHDFICGPRWAQELHKRIPGAELVTFENSGHFAHVEEPEKFASVVAGFVSRATG